MSAPIPTTIKDDKTKVTIAPWLGASLLGFEALREGQSIALMRPASQEVRSVLDTSMVLMAPWVNRISGGGFTHGDLRIDLEPNFPDQALPLHGNALQLPWDVDDASDTHATLSLFSTGPGPYRYKAKVEYSLDDGKFDTHLSIRNESDHPLPFGLGFHPWFVRTETTELFAPAKQVCIMGENLLPVQWKPLSAHPELDFGKSRSLPSFHVDNPFCGWDGHAIISWKDLGISMSVKATSEVSTHYQVYSPDPGCGFFCLEPVSHGVDEHNLGLSSPNPGLVILGKNQSMSAGISLQWQGF